MTLDEAVTEFSTALDAKTQALVSEIERLIIDCPLTLDRGSWRAKPILICVPSRQCTIRYGVSIWIRERNCACTLTATGPAIQRPLQATHMFRSSRAGRPGRARPMRANLCF